MRGLLTRKAMAEQEREATATRLRALVRITAERDRLREQNAELLEALKVFVKLVNNDTILVAGDRNRKRLIKALTKGNAALAKAEGGE